MGHLLRGGDRRIHRPELLDGTVIAAIGTAEIKRRDDFGHDEAAGPLRKLLPETKGKRLEDIQAYFQARVDGNG